MSAIRVQIIVFLAVLVAAQADVLNRRSEGTDEGFFTTILFLKIFSCQTGFRRHDQENMFSESPILGHISTKQCSLVCPPLGEDVS